MECKECGFKLWNPIKELPHSSLGLYNDARFKGRSILMLNSHQENLELLDAKTLNSFMSDVVESVKAIKLATGVERVNVAILGNTVAHVHAHLIPRYPALEPYPNKSPWDDTREKTQLSPEEVFNLVESIKAKLLVGL